MNASGLASLCLGSSPWLASATWNSIVCDTCMPKNIYIYNYIYIYIVYVLTFHCLSGYRLIHTYQWSMITSCWLRSALWTKICIQLQFCQSHNCTHSQAISETLQPVQNTTSSDKFGRGSAALRYWKDPGLHSAACLPFAPFGDMATKFWWAGL